MKTCRRCFKEKPIEEFYTHKLMFDGHLNVCKTCVKQRISIWSKSEHGREVEKRRDHSEKRKQWRNKYLTERRKSIEPEKYQARYKVRNAIRDKKLTKGVCEICGEIKAYAHHNDYTKPLEVKWLCIIHHRAIHNFS